MISKGQATDLPGYKKASFLLYYNGGEIWFEHLEDLYDHDDLVVKKLQADTPSFIKPSSPAFVCFVLFETAITDAVFLAVKKAVLESNKRFLKIAFCGLGIKDQRRFQKALVNHGFGIAFFDGLEEAKMWLLP